jgi:heptosyltransferase-3
MPYRRILVIATRQIGDVLLITPLLRSLHHAYPKAQLDVLAFAGQAGMLLGNGDVHQVIEIACKPSMQQHRQLLRQIFRRYDLAIATLTGDKPLLYAWLAAERRIACVPPAPWQSVWKRWICHAVVPFDDVNSHTVIQNLRLADLLHISRDYALYPPVSAEKIPPLPADFVVLHLSPMWPYKRWPATHWQELLDFFQQKKMAVVLTGGNHAEELAYIHSVVGKRDVINLAGCLSLAQVAVILRQARAYLGPDTAVTHLAAASGVLTVALFGPTNPVKWSPWPVDYHCDRNPFVRKAVCQQVGNVVVLQADLPCVPCHQEGCDRHRHSRSLCMEQLSVNQVIKTLPYYNL